MHDIYFFFTINVEYGYLNFRLQRESMSITGDLCVHFDMIFIYILVPILVYSTTHISIYKIKIK